MPLDHLNKPMFPAARVLSTVVLMIALSVGIVHAQTVPLESGLDLTIKMQDALGPNRDEEPPAASQPRKEEQPGNGPPLAR